MEDLIMALLLLDATKRDLKLVLTLYILYLSWQRNDKKEGRVYKMRDLSALTAITSTAIASSFEDLVRYNIVGKIIFNIKDVTKREIVNKFTNEFLATLKSKEMPVREAISRVGYYITDDNMAFVLNPIVETWKYPGWKKVKKALENLDGLVENPLVKELIKNKNTCKNVEDGKIDGLSIKKGLVIFNDRFKQNYHSKYATAGVIDFKATKAVLKQLSMNNLGGLKQFVKFIDYAFEKAKERDRVLHICDLKYHANDFIVNMVKPSSNFYYDDKGVLRKRL